MSYQNTGKPNGRPNKLERDLAIVADAKNGMTSHELGKKYGLDRHYVQKIASEYYRKERIKKVEAEVKENLRLYAERDDQIRKLYGKIKPKGKNNELLQIQQQQFYERCLCV